MLQKLRGGCAVTGGAGNADAGIDADRAVFKAETTRDRVNHPGREHCGITFAVAFRCLDDRKFIAAETAYQVIFTKDGGNS